MMFYAMNPDGTIRPCGRFPTAEERRVACDTPFPGIKVSTVFLGLDHSFYRGAPPILFETMIFGGPLDEYQERYCTRDEALAGHNAALEAAIAAGPGEAPDAP